MDRFTHEQLHHVGIDFKSTSIPEELQSLEATYFCYGVIFAQHVVFTFEEIFNALSKNRQVNSSTLHNLLAYHRQRGHIVPIRWGLYYSVPKGLYVFQDVKYRKVSIPIPLKKKNKKRFGIVSVDRLGQEVFVTSLERTLVDVLDRSIECISSFPSSSSRRKEDSLP